MNSIFKYIINIFTNIMNNTYIYNEELFYSKIIPLVSLILCIPIFFINCIKKKNNLNNSNESNNLNKNILEDNNNILIINNTNNDYDLPSYSELFKN